MRLRLQLGEDVERGEVDAVDGDVVAVHLTGVPSSHSLQVPAGEVLVGEADPAQVGHQHLQAGLVTREHHHRGLCTSSSIKTTGN